MAQTLDGRKIAILATDGFEQSELIAPRTTLAQAGADVAVISQTAKAIRGTHGHRWGEDVQVDATLDQAQADRFDALVLPGGVYNPDQLRQDPKAIAFIRAFHEAGKPIAAICHGPWLLIEAGIIKGKKATAYPSIKTDMINAGADWIDQPAVVDGNIITSRSPKDLDAFSSALMEALSA